MPSPEPKTPLNPAVAANPARAGGGAAIIDGKALSEEIRQSLRARITSAKRPVRLDAVLVGDDKSAAIYVENQAKTCRDVGIEYVLDRLPASTSGDTIVATIEALNRDESVKGIMVHMPLPEGVDIERIQSTIAPSKDVEGVNPANIGGAVYGRRSFVPCTALAAYELIESTKVPLRGSQCVIVGASNIVGKPIAILLMRAEATVISANKYTKDLASLTRTGDILVSAAGVPGLIKPEMVKPGAVVIDVGINRVKGSDGKTHTVGDVAFDAVRAVAGGITPVPGGVGPMTVAMLLRNCVDAALR
jgi:methylenetetrahydrofolate dehydrogenase (NADP+)/methenyltetrahydrofolate cyclohydrolase